MKAKEALELLKDIPKENWIVSRFTNEIDSCCAIGHLKRLTSKNIEDYSILNCTDRIYDVEDNVAPIRENSSRFLKGIGIATVNNRKTEGYYQDHPKDRVIALLKDMIEAGY